MITNQMWLFFFEGFLFFPSEWMSYSEQIFMNLKELELVCSMLVKAMQSKFVQFFLLLLQTCLPFLACFWKTCIMW